MKGKNTNTNPAGQPIITIPPEAEKPTKPSDSGNSQSAMGRTEALTAKLTQVPKSEIDAKR